MRKGPREGVIVGDVLDALNALDGVHAWRNNTGSATIRGRPVRFGERGSADVLAVVRGKFLAVECKTATGRQSADQRRWAQAVTDAGGLYVLARSATEAVQAARDDGKIANSEYMDRRHEITQRWIAECNRLLRERREG